MYIYQNMPRATRTHFCLQFFCCFAYGDCFVMLFGSESAGSCKRCPRVLIFLRQPWRWRRVDVCWCHAVELFLAGKLFLNTPSAQKRSQAVVLNISTAQEIETRHVLVGWIVFHVPPVCMVIFALQPVVFWGCWSFQTMKGRFTI